MDGPRPARAWESEDWRDGEAASGCGNTVQGQAPAQPGARDASVPPHPLGQIKVGGESCSSFRGNWLNKTKSTYHLMSLENLPRDSSLPICQPGRAPQNVRHQVQLSHLTDGETESFGRTPAQSPMASPEAESLSRPLQFFCLLNQPQGLGCNLPGAKAFQKGTAGGSSLADGKPGQARRCRVLSGQGGASVQAGQGGGQPPTGSCPPPQPEALESLNPAATPAPAPAPAPPGAPAGILALVPLGGPGGYHRRW